MVTKLRASIQILEIEVYFLREELKEKSFLHSSLMSLTIEKQNAKICPKLPTIPEKSTASSAISKKQALTSNINIDFHIDNDLKNEHNSEVNKVKKVFFTTDNANNDSSHTNTKSKNSNSNSNSNNINGNNNSDGIQCTITSNPSPNPSQNEPPDQSNGE